MFGLFADQIVLVLEKMHKQDIQLLGESLLQVKLDIDLKRMKGIINIWQKIATYDKNKTYIGCPPKNAL